MAPRFDHERLKVYEKALGFAIWVGPLIDRLPIKLSVRDQLDRSSTSIVLNLAEGNGKRGHADRCRYFDTSRGSAVECAACLDLLVARQKCVAEDVEPGKAMLLEIVSMLAGLISRFSADQRTDRVREDSLESADELDVVLREKD